MGHKTSRSQEYQTNYNLEILNMLQDIPSPHLTPSQNMGFV